MNSDGSDVKRLTDDSFDDKEPEWSPNGSKIAFSSMRHLNIGEIYVMNADGTQQTRRTQSSGGLLSGAMSPAWSPDGTKIVYAARSGFLDGPEGLLPRLYTTVASADLRCDPQGSVLRKSPQAIKNHEQLTAYTNPAWSPDGTKIAFSHLVSYLVVGVQQIKIMNVDGSGLVALTAQLGAEDDAAWSPDGSKFAFAGRVTGDTWEIYVVNADGSGEVRLTRNSVDDLSPTWSPDGSEIAFQSDRDGRPEIYVMNADGTGVRRLTKSGGSDPDWGPGLAREHQPETQVDLYPCPPDPTPEPAPMPDFGPVWSPDGRKIAFSQGYEAQIYVMSADGTNQTQLTSSFKNDRCNCNLADNRYLAWSPDGSKIAFSSDRDLPVDNPKYEVYVMNADGAEQTRLTNTDAQDYWPTWSPDGSKIAFSSNRDGFAAICIMNADGSGLARLTSEGSGFAEPAWSPKGSRIVVRWQDPDFRLRDYDLFFIDVDGGEPVRLTDDPGDPRFASWSPDGSMIAFSSDIDGNSQIFVVNVDGSGLTQLTHHLHDASMPTWSPDGSKIAYAARIAFSAGRGLESVIFVMNVDGSDQVQLTKVDTFSPTLAPAP